MPCVVDGREADDTRLSQTADNPGPDHADPLVAVREGKKESLYGVQGVSPLPAGGIFWPGF